MLLHVFEGNENESERGRGRAEARRRGLSNEGRPRESFRDKGRDNTRLWKLWGRGERVRLPWGREGVEEGSGHDSKVGKDEAREKYEES